MKLHLEGPLRAAALGTLLAGCAETAPPGTTTMRITPGPDAEAPPARGETPLMVRAVSADAAGSDVPSAVCDATSPYYAARFPAPARLLIPDYASQSPNVVVSCKAGALSGRATAVPGAANSGSGFGSPAIGISVGTGGGWNGWDGWGGHGAGVGLTWWGGGYNEPSARYPAVSVPMR